MTSYNHQLFLDCDGVLAAFDKKAIELFDGLHPAEYEAKHGSKKFWKTLYACPDLFTNLDPMEDAFELFDAVHHLRPIILTGCPHGGWAEFQKFAWRDKHFPGVPMVCTKSVNKRHFMKPGDTIVDDWDKYKHLWEEAGGNFVLHTSAKDSIEQLKGLGVL